MKSNIWTWDSKQNGIRFPSKLWMFRFLHIDFNSSIIDLHYLSLFNVFNTNKKQVAGAHFRGLLLICLLNWTLNKKLSSHSLQFASKYHVFLDSLQVQIREHIHHSSNPANYHVFLDSLWLQIREHTHRSLGLAALYYTAVELEKM